MGKILTSKEISIKIKDQYNWLIKSILDKNDCIFHNIDSSLLILRINFSVITETEPKEYINLSEGKQRFVVRNFNQVIEIFKLLNLYKDSYVDNLEIEYKIATDKNLDMAVFMRVSCLKPINL